MSDSSEPDNHTHDQYTYYQSISQLPQSPQVSRYSQGFPSPVPSRSRASSIANSELYEEMNPSEAASDDGHQTPLLKPPKSQPRPQPQPRLQPQPPPSHVQSRNKDEKHAAAAKESAVIDQSSRADSRNDDENDHSIYRPPREVPPVVLDVVVVDKQLRRLTYIPICFVLLRLWGTINVIKDILVGSSDHFFVVDVLEAFGDQAQGLVHSLIFVFTHQGVRNALYQKWKG